MRDLREPGFFHAREHLVQVLVAGSRLVDGRVAHVDHHAELLIAGAFHVLGLSTQDTAYQQEAVARLHLPFAILSDEKLALTKALRLPTMEVAGLMLLKRMALVIDDGAITKVFYPVFPPDRNAADVLAWLKANPKR